MGLVRKPRHSPAKPCQRGAAVVEGLFVILLFLMVFFAIVEFARVTWLSSSVAYGAQRGVLYAVVNGSNLSDLPSPGTPATAADVKNQVVAALPELSAATVTTTWPDGTNAPGAPVKVSVSLPVSFLIPGLDIAPITLTSSAQMVISGPQPGGG